MPADTLCLIFEEDFRFWPERMDPDRADDYKWRVKDMAKRRRGDGAWRQPRGSVAQEPTPKWGARPPTVPWTSGAYRPDEAAKGRAKGKKLVGQYHFTPIRGSTDRKDPNDGLSREVADMLRMCTLAHRNGMGNIVWLGWNGRNDSPTWLSNGSTAIAVSKKGGEVIKEAFDAGKVPRGHIDLKLAEWLRRGEEAYRARACWIYPAVGSYYEHESECDPKQFGYGKTRAAGWALKSASQGTRISDDFDKGMRSKWLIQWSGGDRAKRLWYPFPKDSVLHSKAYEWKSYREEEPTASSSKGKGKEKDEFSQRLGWVGLAGREERVAGIALRWTERG